MALTLLRGRGLFPRLFYLCKNPLDNGFNTVRVPCVEKEGVKRLKWVEVVRAAAAHAHATPSLSTISSVYTSWGAHARRGGRKTGLAVMMSLSALSASGSGVFALSHSTRGPSAGPKASRSRRAAAAAGQN